MRQHLPHAMALWTSGAESGAQVQCPLDDTCGTMASNKRLYARNSVIPNSHVHLAKAGEEDMVKTLQEQGPLERFGNNGYGWLTGWLVG